MNYLTNKTLVGALGLTIMHGLVLARACGLHIPEAVDGALSQCLADAASLYLLWCGHTDALNTPPPVKGE